MAYELVTLKRDCKAITIPYGTETVVFKDEKVYITQTLGGSFTIQRDNGQLVRIDGQDADVLGKEVPAEAKVFKIAIRGRSAPGRQGNRKGCMGPLENLL